MPAALVGRRSGCGAAAGSSWLHGIISASRRSEMPAEVQMLSYGARREPLPAKSQKNPAGSSLTHELFE